MKARKSVVWTMVVTFSAMLTTALEVRGQAVPASHTVPAIPDHYKFIDIGTFGGPSVGLAVEPIAQILSPQGVAVGEANTRTPNPYYPNANPFLGLGTNVGHAFAWQNGTLVDLGTLPGGVNSAADWISQNGLMQAPRRMERSIRC